MSIYDFDWDSSRLDHRLQAIGLDPHQQFADEWERIFDRAFTRSDLTLARSALQSRSIEPAWIIDIGPASDLLPTTDFTICADTVEDALAFLLCRAIDESYFPDSVRWDETNEAIHFKVRGKVWADVFPLRPRPQTGAVRSRAASTLLGVRGRTLPEEELLRRLRRWPGTAAIQAVDRERLRDDVRDTHIPDPREWLLSAKILLEQMGLKADQMAVQRLVCAVFGAPSWNHLVAAVTKYRASGSLPCAVLAADRDGDYRLVGVYADYFDALPHYLHTAVSLATDWPGMNLELIENHGAPSLYLRSPADGSDGRWSSANVVLTMLDKATDLEDDQRNRQAVASMIATEGSLSEAVLEELFMIGRPLSARRQLVDGVGRLRLVAEDSGWRFHECTQPHERYLMVERVDESGNRIHRAVFVLYRKAQIHLVESAGLYAITGEYNGRRPEAAVRISAATAQLLAKTMPEMRLALTRWNEGYWDEDDQRRFARLAENARLS